MLTGPHRIATPHRGTYIQSAEEGGGIMLHCVKTAAAIIDSTEEKHPASNMATHS